MKAWEEDLVQYRLFPAPPRMPLNEYIQKYLDEKDEKYLQWFLHYFEPQLNRRIGTLVQNYAMQGHFADLKAAYIAGLAEALNSYNPACGTDFMQYKEDTVSREVLKYIRTMRTGYTIPSEHEYRMLRKVMRCYRESGEKCDDEAISRIAEKVGLKPKTVKELLQAGLRNEGLVSFYREEDEDESGTEDITSDSTLSPEVVFFRAERRKAVLGAFEELTPRQRYYLSWHLHFCEDCYLYKAGISFAEMAWQSGLSSAEAAEKAYKKALGVLRAKVKAWR